MESQARSQRHRAVTVAAGLAAVTRKSRSRVVAAARARRRAPVLGRPGPTRTEAVSERSDPSHVMMQLSDPSHAMMATDHDGNLQLETTIKPRSQVLGSGPLAPSMGVI
jgi:hypothetical protein